MSSLPHADSTQGGNGRCLDLLDYSVHSTNKQTNIKDHESYITSKSSDSECEKQQLSIKHDKGPNGGAEKLKEKSQ